MLPTQDSLAMASQGESINVLENGGLSMLIKIFNCDLEITSSSYSKASVHVNGLTRYKIRLAGAKEQEKSIKIRGFSNSPQRGYLLDSILEVPIFPKKLF